jgi:membrane associated rhomboid family serine protease
MFWRNLAPPATLALFVGTVATYLFQVLAGGDVVERAVGLIPTNVSSLVTVAAAGTGQAVPAWLTLVTYMFPHGSWWHVATNAAGLWFLGRLAEPVMGARRFLSAYLASGLFTGLVIVALVPHWTKPVVGASGAISGVLGAFLALHSPRRPFLDRRNLALLTVESATLLGVVAWLLGRTTPQAPDRVSALMWHLLPFVMGWAAVLAGRCVHHRGWRLS